MTTHLTELVDGLNEKFGDQAFLTLTDLVEIGLFDNTISARKAIQKGFLPYIRVSYRRSLVPKNALLAYLRKGLSK